jgi:hypothetical protein
MLSKILLQGGFIDFFGYQVFFAQGTTIVGINI